MKSDELESDEPQQLNSLDNALVADANNNGTSCRFCGLCLDEEGQLQLHQLMEHSLEYVAMLQQPSLEQQPQQGSEEDKLVTQVALQMVEANNHHQLRQYPHQLQRNKQTRKTSAASSASGGASSASSSATSSAEIGDGGGGGAAKGRTIPDVRHQCPQCKRKYQSEQKLEQHQRMVHHNFVAKLSPAKRTIISPSGHLIRKR